MKTSLIFILMLITVFHFSCVNDNDKSNSFVKDIDGNKYHTVTIGTQIWMVENLKTTRYRNGDPISHETDNIAWSKMTTGAYCNYDNDYDIGKIYGRLFNWYAINDNRQIAPYGWRVPSDSDWNLLITFLGGYNVAGGKLKEIGTMYWASPNEGATNETSFSGLPGSFRRTDGSFGDIGFDGFWWTSTEYDSTRALGRDMDSDVPDIFIGYYHKKMGCSIRCIKDN